MVIDTLLLLALPASGKSEIRRYLGHVPSEILSGDMHLRPTVQVDDYPYVHLMRRISEVQVNLGLDPTFFRSSGEPFLHPADWITLIHLVNEDVAGLGVVTGHDPDPVALLDRLDRARSRAGMAAGVAEGRDEVANAIIDEARHLAADLPVVDKKRLEDSSLLIEFARGGPDGASLPLDPPFGYEHSLAALDASILERASVLYVWVTPQESRRRNRDRAILGEEGDASILHHGVPEAVMLGDYGVDDIDWLESTSGIPGTIAVDRGDLGRSPLPFARFDNREDKTSFLRAEPQEWDADDTSRLHSALSEALRILADRQELR